MPARPAHRHISGDPLDYGHPDLYASSPPQRVLQDVTFARHTGALCQIGLVSVYAAELFGDLFAETRALQTRVAAAADRADALSRTLPYLEAKVAMLGDDDLDNLESDAAKAFTKSARRTTKHSTVAFAKATLPRTMRDRYDDPDVERLPDFSRLDALFGEGHKCCDKYSNPGIFLAQWAAKELATLTALKEEKDARKAERKQRKKLAKRAAKRQAELEAGKERTKLASKGLNWKSRYGLLGDDMVDDDPAPPPSRKLLAETPEIPPTKKKKKPPPPMPGAKPPPPMPGKPKPKPPPPRAKPPPPATSGDHAKYVKMLQMGIPKAAVAMKMANEGLDPSVLDGGDDAPSQPAPPPMLEGTNTITWYRAVPTGIAAFVFAASLILWQHLKRRRLHQRISTRV